MSKPKTYRQIFESVKEPWGKLALENCNVLDVTTTGSPSDILGTAFRFKESAQGHDFWWKLYIYGIADDKLRLDLKQDAERENPVAEQSA